MKKIAFRIPLRPGQLAAFRERHDAIWSERVEAFHAAGVRDYSIHHEPGSHILFAVLWRSREHNMGFLPFQPVMRRWWQANAPVLEINTDKSPAKVPLETVFHLR